MKKNINKYQILLSRVFLVIIFALLIFIRFRKEKEIGYIAKVNGRKIYSVDYISRLKQQTNEQVLKQLIDEELIKKEAEDKEIKISKKEIDDEYKKIKENIKNQGKNFKDEIKLKNMTTDDVINQIYIQKLISKLVNLNIIVTKTDIDKFIEDNKNSLPKNVNDAQLRLMIENEVREKLQNGKVNNWIESLHRKAKITYY